MRAVLISTYDLGRQPFGLASPAAFLRRAGHEVVCVDLTRGALDAGLVGGAEVVGFYLPMHTATRLALPVIDKVRALNPSAHIAAYGLYAPLNAELLRGRGVHSVLGPEFESDLLRLAESIVPGNSRLEPGDTRLQPGDTRLEPGDTSPPASALPRISFITPDRSDLPPLSRYASLQVGDARKTVGYTEATRGCKHLCRHCPIVPVYQGRFRAVPADVVMADVRAQIAAGAQHITFGDPDFFNGPAHAQAIVRALARDCPGISYDVTIKVEHLKRHAALLPLLKETGCAFVTCAVESFEDEVLGKLRKGHTHADFEGVVGACAAIGLPLSPTFVAFTPWTTMASYVRMLGEIERLGLIGAVAPIQYAIRLLVPEGSLMLELEDVRERITHFDPASLAHVWRHRDAAVDALQHNLERLVGQRLTAPRAEMFMRVREVACAAAGLPIPPAAPLLSRAAVPYLNEPWYC